MPQITSPQIGLALDMFGCPNRCRHCYLGARHPGRATEEDLRWMVEQFRHFKRPGEDQGLWKEFRVATFFYEPDYSPDYKRLYELENELSNLPSPRAEGELLSAWRLARDPDYAKWAFDIGLRQCQLTFFGLEETTDWGVRRRGAFQDLLTATERLLEAGIRPRWQWFFTKKLLPDLPGLIDLTEKLNLRERCRAVGGEFRLFMHCPAPAGAARQLEHLRPTLEDLQQVPEWLRDKNELECEAQILPRLLEDPTPILKSVSDIHPVLSMLITSSLDVYSNANALTPAWRLGNLKTDGLTSIVDTFENDKTPGLAAMFRAPISELAKRFGRPHSRRIYHPSDLKERWAHMWADEMMKK